MTTMMAEKETVRNNLITTSEEMAKRLLQGWTMLESVCCICNETPLLKQKKSLRRFCVRCNVYINSENVEEAPSTVVASTSASIDETKKEEEGTNQQEDEETRNEGSTISGAKEMHEGQTGEEHLNSNLNGQRLNTIELEKRNNCILLDQLKLNKNFFEEEQERNAKAIKKENIKKENIKKENIQKDEVKYIKEIKLQNKEFNDLIYEATFPEIEATSMVDFNKYVNEKCGDCFSDLTNWNFSVYERNESETKVEEAELKDNKNRATERVHSNGTYTSKDFDVHRECFIFKKAKHALMNTLNRYAEELNSNDKENEEVELVKKMTQVVTLLEKINDLNKTLTI